LLFPKRRIGKGQVGKGGQVVKRTACQLSPAISPIYPLALRLRLRVSYFMGFAHIFHLPRNIPLLTTLSFFTFTKKLLVYETYT